MVIERAKEVNFFRLSHLRNVIGITYLNPVRFLFFAESLNKN